MNTPAKFFAAFVAFQHVLVSSALAWPAITTANVNMRSGPGTGFKVMRTVGEGTDLQVEQCDASGSWCAITFDGQTGFMAGAYLRATDLPEGWPRQYTTDGGATITLHQPQITEWPDYETATALVAAEYQKQGETKSELGVIEFAADSDVDHDTGEVLISNIKATNLNFSTLDRESLADLALRVGEIIPVEPLSMSLDSMTANLESYQQLSDIGGLKADPPPIFFSSRPAILLQTNGEAITAPVEGVDGLSFVINTNWDLLKTDEDGTWYLRNDSSWLMSNLLSGPWEPVDTLPEIFSRLPEEDWPDARQAIPAQPFEEATPRIFYSDRPAELITTSGVPALERVPGTDLQWVSNSETDIFFHQPEGNWYFLISGRWFRAPSLDGLWTFATPDLPADFRNIPGDKPYYTVRSSIPGTSESDEARLLASIPEIARVEVGSVTADVEYAGEPRFERIEGTDLYYAVNSDDVVIRVGDKYYVVKDGIWFVGDSPEGPFEIARAVPDVVYTIPPSSPVYNITYVRIYDVEPDAVWYGYTAGYLYVYVGWGTIVYGSGWYHRPYWHRWKRHRYPIYFRRHLTYGCGIYYNPIRRAFGRYGYRYGPHRGLGLERRYHWRKHRHVGVRPVFRRSNQRDFLSAYSPARNVSGDRTVPLAGNDVYGNWRNNGVKRGRALARDRQRVEARAKLRWRQFTGEPAARTAKRKEFFAGKDGSVYRRENGQWQRRESSSWRRADENNGDRRVRTQRTRKTEQKTIRRKTTTRQKTRIRSETVKRRQKPHLRRTLDARKDRNRRTIQRRQLSGPKVQKRDRGNRKPLWREEKRR
jgi:uncharacterized protein YraI